VGGRVNLALGKSGQLARLFLVLFFTLDATSCYAALPLDSSRLSGVVKGICRKSQT
jgi:hypothetical protein